MSNNSPPLTVFFFKFFYTNASVSEHTLLDSACVGSFELDGCSVTCDLWWNSSGSDGLLFLANMRINDILKYFRNNSYFTKPKETATKLNVLLNKERTF